MFCFPLYYHHYDTLKKYQGNYLEIGVYNGDAIANIARAYPEKYIIGIDPFIEDGCTSHDSGVVKGNRLITQRDETYRNIKDLKNVFFYEMTSGYFYQNITEKHVSDANVNVVMIDGDHSYDAVKTDIDLALRMIGNKNGEISFDDISLDDVKRAMIYFEKIAGNRIIQKIHTEWACCIYVISKTR